LGYNSKEDKYTTILRATVLKNIIVGNTKALWEIGGSGKLADVNTFHISRSFTDPSFLSQSANEWCVV
jgi:hypothetical protein